MPAVLVYAGIDEAGYGPLLGPLVVTRAVFRVSDADRRAEPPCLWARLSPAVARAGERGDQGARAAKAPFAFVDDSKRLYGPAGDLRRLEAGVLALLPGEEPPRSLADLLSRVAADEASRSMTLPWYQEEAGGPALPSEADPAAMSRTRAAVAGSLVAAGVEVAEVRAAVVLEDRFNLAVVEAGNKAAAAWRFVAGHLAEIWRVYGREHPVVALDRQGGRKFYGEALERLFPQASCLVREESPERCAYGIEGEGRSMRLEVRPRSESLHLPVAYASMAAKYARELLMKRFQRYWSERAPDVRPTAGYYADGRRFLREMAPRLRSLGIAAGTLVRSC